MPFTIEHIPDTAIIRTRIQGLFSASDATKLMQAYVDLLGSLGRPSSDFEQLVDMRVSPIQPRDLVSMLSDFLHQSDKKPKRIAFVHGNAAVKMQARRVSTEHGGEHFVTEEEAIAWLVNGGEATGR